MFNIHFLRFRDHRAFPFLRGFPSPQDLVVRSQRTHRSLVVTGNELPHGEQALRSLTSLQQVWLAGVSPESLVTQVTWPAQGVGTI